MAFTINDLQDLVRILREQPEWLSEVRRIVLTDELLTLPALMRELAVRIEQIAEFQRRNEEQLAELRRRTDERFAELAEAQRRNEEQLAELRRRTDERFAELAEAQRRNEEQLAEFQRRTDERFAELAEFQRRTDERFAELAQAIAELRQEIARIWQEIAKIWQEIELLRREMVLLRQDVNELKQEMGQVRGKLLEMDYRNKLGAIFGGRIRKPQLVDGSDLWELFEERLDEAEIRQIAAADLIARGRLPPKLENKELWLVIEVSSVIDRNDIQRAAKRAALLRKAGLLVLPVAAGQRLTQGASALAGQMRVAIARNGNLLGWDGALERALV